MSVRWLRPPRPSTAFVLGGGGNLGSVQVGMLRAVLERGVRPDVVLGCSVGALNGALIAEDPTPSGGDRLRDVWLHLHPDVLVPRGHLSFVRLVARRSALLSNAGLRDLIETHIHATRFEDMAVPFQVVATSLVKGDARWFTSGSIVEPILASAALPAVLPPVEIDGEPFIDGGVVDNVPIARAVALGAKRVYVFHVGNFDKPRPNPRRPLDVLLQAFSIARSHRYLMEVADPPEGVELISLPAVRPDGVRRDDFSQTSRLIDDGYEAAARYLDASGRVAPRAARH